MFLIYNFLFVSHCKSKKSVYIYMHMYTNTAQNKSFVNFFHQIIITSQFNFSDIDLASEVAEGLLISDTWTLQRLHTLWLTGMYLMRMGCLIQ